MNRGAIQATQLYFAITGRLTEYRAEGASMLFLVHEACTYEPGDHLVACTNCRLDWLATVRLLQKQGKVLWHFDFKEGRGGATVYKVTSRADLDAILSQHSVLECKMERRINELRNLDEAVDDLSHHIVTG